MPWARTDTVSERLRFVTALRKRRTTFKSLCTAFGVAPKTGYKWLHQFEAAGPAGLEDRSRRPRSNSRAIASDVADRLVRLRREEPTYGPKKLVAWLEQNEPGWDLPAPSTVGELLKRRGLVQPRKRLRHQSPQREPLRHADRPNAVWSMDFKGFFRLGDGTRCDPLTITDAFSRFLLCCKAGTAVGNTVSKNVWSSLAELFREYGMPDAIRVDNGQPWAAPKGSLGITKLSVNLIKAGIHVERIRPGKPQDNGRHERFHLTLLQETARPPARNMYAQQRRFDEFQWKYNNRRPHEALQQRPPRSVYEPSRKRFPTEIEEPEYPIWYQVAVPYGNGKVKFRGSEFFISGALHNQIIGLAEVEEGCFAVYFCKTLLGHLHTAHPELGVIAA
jgi:transposase InsO family protein